MCHKKTQVLKCVKAIYVTFLGELLNTGQQLCRKL